MIGALALLCFVVACLAKTSPKITDEVVFDVTIGGNPAGQIKLGLFGLTQKEFAQNFCEIAKGVHDVEGDFPGMTYKNTIFHRIIKDFMIQGGDFERFNGTGGKSIYYKDFPRGFPDGQGLNKIKHRVGSLSMANAGPNTNGSQFFITTVKTPWLDGRHVVFGHIIGGVDLVKQLNTITTDRSDKPIDEVKIVDSQCIHLEEPYTIEFDETLQKL